MYHFHRCSALFIFLLTLATLAGCDGTIGEGSGTTTSYDDYVGTKSDAELKGWTEFGFVFADGNDVEARIVPEQPVAGEPAKIELHFTCDFKLPEHYIFTRVGNNELGILENPSEGGEWTKMNITGGMLWSHKKKKMVDISKTVQTPKKKQAGKSYYEAELTFPPGDSFLEFKIENQFDDSVLATSLIKVTMPEEKSDESESEEKSSDEKE